MAKVVKKRKETALETDIAYERSQELIRFVQNIVGRKRHVRSLEIRNGQLLMTYEDETNDIDPVDPTMTSRFRYSFGQQIIEIKHSDVKSR